jgi:Xaa-Pro aminopeptidase
VNETWNGELRARRERMREILGRAACDAGLVFGCDGHAQGFRYLTNFAPVLGDMWILLAPAGERCVLTFQWQIEEARGRSGIDRWDAAFDPTPLVVEALRESGARRVGIAGLERLPVPAHRALLDGVEGLELVDVGEPFTALRRRKSAVEIEALRAAARLTDRMLDAAREGARGGVTETELAARVSAIPQAAGGAVAFETTVVSGVDEPIPIRRPTERALRAGDTVMVDLGAELDGYQADASRTFVLGRASAEQRRAWDVVRRAYDAALALARPGVPCRDLHAAAAAIVEDAGYEVAHRVGHGIGLATSYEWPSLDTETASLEPGMAICIEPGVYAPGAGNVKLEDDVLITDDGCELLTGSDATLEIA